MGSIFGGIRKSRWEVSLWTRYDRVRFKTEPKSRPAEELIKAGLLLAYDVRDWDVFPTRGFLSRAGVWQIWEKGGGRLYNCYTAECSFFHNLWSDHVLALDAAVSVSTGKVPLYDRLYFGGQRTLRGIPVGSYDGTQSVVVSCEYRMPVSRFQKNRIEASLQGAVVYFFLDAGTIADSMPELRRKEIIVNPGAGLFWVLTPEGGLKLDLSVHPPFRLTASSVWRF